MNNKPQVKSTEANTCNAKKFMNNKPQVKSTEANTCNANKYATTPAASPPNFLLCTRYRSKNL